MLGAPKSGAPSASILGYCPVVATALAVSVRRSTPTHPKPGCVGDPGTPWGYHLSPADAGPGRMRGAWLASRWAKATCAA